MLVIRKSNVVSYNHSNMLLVLSFLAKPDRRLIMFYLANDVIQNSRKKGKEFSQSFTKVLGDSMQYLRFVLEIIHL